MDDKLVKTKDLAQEFFSTLASAASGALTTPEKAVELYALTYQYANLLEELVETAKKYIKAHVVTSGVPNKTGSTRAARIGEFEVEVRQNRAGYDDERILALLRRHDIALESGMDMRVKYVANSLKLGALAASGALTNEELRNCEREVVWALQPVKAAKNE